MCHARIPGRGTKRRVRGEGPPGDQRAARGRSHPLCSNYHNKRVDVLHSHKGVSPMFLPALFWCAKMITVKERKECVLTQERCLLQTAIGKLLKNHTQDRQSFKQCSITSVSVHSYHHTLTPIMLSSPSNEIQIFLSMHSNFLLRFLPILSS